MSRRPEVWDELHAAIRTAVPKARTCTGTFIQTLSPNPDGHMHIYSLTEEAHSKHRLYLLQSLMSFTVAFNQKLRGIQKKLERKMTPCQETKQSTETD